MRQFCASTARRGQLTNFLVPVGEHLRPTKWSQVQPETFPSGHSGGYCRGFHGKYGVYEFTRTQLVNIQS